MGLISRVSSRTYRKNKKVETMPASKKFPTRAAWKSNYFDKLKNAIKNHNKFLLVNADNVASLQFAQIRRSCRGQAEIVMGKNTMMKKVIRGLLEEDYESFKDYEKVLPALVENVGFVFTNGDLKEIRDLLLSNKVGMSEATLLNMLKISPFSYGLKCVQCFEEGSLFDPSILDVTDEDIRAKFMDGVNRVAAASLNIGYPTMVSAPHSIANGLKKLLAVAAATDINFAAAEKMKAYLADPSAFAVAAPAAAADAAPAEKAEEPEEEESDESMGFDLFG